MCTCMHVYICTCAWNALGTCTASWVDMGGGGMTHNDVQVQAFFSMVRHSTQHQCQACYRPLGPLRSTDPTSGGGQHSIQFVTTTVHRDGYNLLKNVLCGLGSAALHIRVRANLASSIITNRAGPGPVS